MVSIIVPVYNGEKYIKDCVASLINQTYKDIEIILIDDGSMDNTSAILDEIKDTDNRIRVIYKENGGVSSARNAGIDAANGNYIMFCDCDDIPMKNWCEDLVNCAELYPDRLPICGIQIDMDVNSELCDMHITGVGMDDRYGLYNAESVLFLLQSNIVNSPCNKIYSMDVVKVNSLRFDTQESMGEDLLFNLQYLFYMGGKTVYVNELLYKYIRQNSESLSLTITTLNGVAKYGSRFLDKEYSLFCLLTPRENQKAFDNMNKYFFDQYIDTIMGIASNKRISKRERWKITAQIIGSSMFQRCINAISQNDLNNIKSLKLEKFKLKSYSFIKIFFK